MHNLKFIITLLLLISCQLYAAEVAPRKAESIEKREKHKTALAILPIRQINISYKQRGEFLRNELIHLLVNDYNCIVLDRANSNGLLTENALHNLNRLDSGTNIHIPAVDHIVSGFQYINSTSREEISLRYSEVNREYGQVSKSFESFKTTSMNPDLLCKQLAKKMKLQKSSENSTDIDLSKTETWAVHPCRQSSRKIPQSQ